MKKAAAAQLGLEERLITFIKPLKRSIDARSRNIKVLIKAEVFYNEPGPEQPSFYIAYPDVSKKKPVLIAGAGPAGMFAALRLIELGRKPIIIERGKDVKSRRRDLAAINKNHIVNPDSNYCFGEGGAGTYSDGKLYTRATKKGNVKKVLETLVAHGAPHDILVDAHPHIGTNLLPKVVEALRKTILNAGGEIHFNQRIVDIAIADNAVKGVVTHTGDKFDADSLILATGHSARNIFEMLQTKKILLESKPFAMGVRIEHPQALIDAMQYHCQDEELNKQRQYLPAAAYRMVQQVKGRGVYSFCMCPGGFIVPAATSQEEVVVNGMSPSKRDSRFANSGIVVATDPEDLQPYLKYGTLAGLRFQQCLERNAWEAGGKTQAAPAQRLVDFCENKISSSLPDTSYKPGVNSVPLNLLLSDNIARRLQQAFRLSAKTMKGYYTNEAILLGVESRTSSPVRIPRNSETLEHPQIKGLYPCGEGAGYAGGIMSAAMDGERCGEAIGKFVV